MVSRFFMTCTTVLWCFVTLPQDVVTATASTRYLRPKNAKNEGLTATISTKAPSVKSSKSASTTTTSSPPSAAPTIHCLKDIQVDDVLEILLTVSDECLIVTPGTPQNRAYQWDIGR
eukprot:Nitzschia sp. Nitz4//scaffold229_size32011//30393//30743//NITZ4_007923-RA/size32011-processed-gene-0.12-mRNA-1//1//CDS//3329542871//38//frame0